MAGIHIFRKDLRLDDNLALAELGKNVNNIYLFFHLNTYQTEDKKEEYHRSYNAIDFMMMSLENLDKISGNKLNIFKGNEDEWLLFLAKFIKTKKISHLSINLDYTKYSLERDERLNSLCRKNDIIFIANEDDQTIVPMNKLCKDNGEPYMVYHHFNIKLNKCVEENGGVNNISLGLKKTKGSLIIHKFKEKEIEFVYSYKKPIEKIVNASLFITNKRARKQIINNWKDRDNLEFDKNTYISPYLNFGVVSSRNVYNMFYENDDFIKQLIWRDFYLCILRFHKHAKEYKWLDERYNRIKWRVVDSNFKKEWEDFINCKTNCLLIDAAMSELKQTGFMSNRCRLLWATYVVKYLQPDPFHKVYGGVNLFSRYLIDCSTSQNKMNFEWIISSLDLGGRRFSKKGCNPLTGRMIKVDNTMIKKYNAYNYIRKWLPEYKDMGDKEMLKIKPNIDLEERYKMFCKMFKSL